MANFASPEVLTKIVDDQKNGVLKGIYSVCATNRFVLEACLHQAAEDGSILLIETTCNQVNQYGGYTGYTPFEFANYIADVAACLKFPSGQILFGGDHLGPNPWKKEPADRAMEKACRMVTDYIRAGYRKIHLDASMHTASDDPFKPLDRLISVERAACLCQASENASKSEAYLPKPLYIIGTEVPTPGGCTSDSVVLEITDPRDALQVIHLFQEVFEKRGLADAWQRVVGLVVQPGVEFGDTEIYEYSRERARNLSRAIESVPGIIFEAHSTDYQPPELLRQMVEYHFAILKVGPALTFAFREALFSLAHIEKEWLVSHPQVTLSNLITTAEEVMLADPKDWIEYYEGSEPEKVIARKYSLSDRIRYYWPDPVLWRSVQQLITNLEKYPPPLTLVSQYLPVQHRRIREGSIANTPTAMITDYIRDVVRDYAFACRTR